MAVLFAILGCEKDDICVDPITPFLVITFKDYEDQSESKSILLDSVWAEGKDLFIEGESTDSIAIPLDLNNDFTLYHFAINNSDDLVKVDDINFAYTRKDVFVGRSCGYKTTFENFNVESNTTNWIKEIEVKKTIIDNDTTEAVTIYH